MLAAGLALACSRSEAPLRAAAQRDVRPVADRPALAEPLPEETASLSAEGRLILDQIQAHGRWPNFAELQRPRFSQAHGGRWVLAFYNGVVGASMERRLLPLPDGAHIILENRQSADTNDPPILTTMSKVSGRWYWMELSNASPRVDDDGRPIAGFGEEGTAACASCHAQASANDYVFSHDFRRRSPATKER